MSRLFIFLVLLSLKAFGQTNLLDFDQAYALGEISNLPDTIVIFTSKQRIEPDQSFTKFVKIKSNNFRLFYWNWGVRGLVEPASYTHHLKVKFKTPRNVQLIFNKRKKRYNIQRQDSQIGVSFKLTVE